MRVRVAAGTSRPALPARDGNVRELATTRIRDDRTNGVAAELVRLAKISVRDTAHPG
ncbi:hypothetical protein [Sorangium sp. So ce1097]|uniref:hypothetical protein n=1 Tax=Sorangium sp. So ce1097 TaxID=3133330 RepID=UPI003F62BADB